MKRSDVIVMVAPGDLGKPRPAIIVQADDLGSTTTTVLVCPLSSDVTADDPLRPVIKPTAENGLRVKSQMMTDKLVALRRDRARAVIGHVDESTRGALDRALLVVLGLAR